MKDCVVFEAFGTNRNDDCIIEGKRMEQQLQQVKHESSRQQEKEQRQHRSLENFCINTWILGKYYFSNKSDISIIDIDKNKQNKTVLLNNNYHDNDNNHHYDESILTVSDNNKNTLDNIGLEEGIDGENKVVSSYPLVNGEVKNENVLQKADCTHKYKNKTIICDKNRSNINIVSSQRPKSNLDLNPINPLSLLLLVLVFSQQQNASFCYRFNSLERYDNNGFYNYNYPYQSTMIPNYNNYAYNNRIRSLIMADPTTVMPSLNNNYNNYNAGPSFVNDQSTNGPPSSAAPQLSGWTSMISTVFQQDTLDKHIKNILVPRVSGTEGNVQVRNYIVESLRANNYHVQLDEFTDPTPIGEVKFANIIADSNPNACRQLVIACHYDSKMMEGFLGATDSAVPCAMLLKMSETFKDSFRSQNDNNGDSNGRNDLSLRFIFFDGEEAFEQWSATDSLYGSRHLAAKWEKTLAPAHCNVKNELKRIELFLILDLIGTSDTTFVMYNRQLAHHYYDLMKYEKNYLNRSGISSVRGIQAFKNRHQPLDWIEDDHVPFYRRGVPILSLLAHPFPKVWHEISDNYSAIDFPRTRRILHVLEEFVANYKK